MKIKLLLFLLLSNLCFSQIKFEPGYYTDNTGTVVKCLIKNEDWLNNPTLIETKLSETDVVVKKTIAEISEFGIDNILKYVKATVDIDDFIDDINSFTSISDNATTKKTIFLKVENEGKANLYSYFYENLKKFYFSKTDEKIKLLIFSKYYNSQNQIVLNNSFRQLLLDELILTQDLQKRLFKLNYNLSELNEFFQIYNYNQNKIIIKKTNQDYKSFNFNIKAGMVFNSYKSLVTANGFDFFSFPAQTNFGFGLEIEHILNFNRNKWSIYLDPTFETFTSNVTDSKLRNSDVSMKIMNTGIGFRHNMFIAQNSNLFINVGLNLTTIIGNKVFIVNTQKFELGNMAFGFAGGIGFKYQKKYIVEYRMRTSQDLTTAYGVFPSSYMASTLFFGYTIF